MTHSFATTESLTCPHCGQPFQTAIWWLVDAVARPDLLAQIEEGTLHRLPCPHCGHRADVDGPILLYRAARKPHLLFSPAQGTTVEQDREQAGGLLEQLSRSLGDRWQDEWLMELVTVPRSALAEALRGDLREVLSRMRAEMAHGTKALARGAGPGH